ncbi:MAG TPA: methyltransferase domain-containing protein [Terriglobia bacterium]|nr:methyltransferase domain-containing protein [Terriglobia bacterium]
MEPETLSLLCDPLTHEPLQLNQERLVNSVSGKEFPIRDGIAIFLDDADVSGENQRYQRLYDRIAPLYDLSMKTYARIKSGGLKKRRMEYLQEMEIEPGSNVLEVSTGTGANLQFLPHTAHYFGLDISLGMLRQCQRQVRKWGMEADLFQGAAEHLPFQEASFDAVLHMGGINFFNDIPQALREMIRVAKPGVKFVIVDETEEVAKRYEKTVGTSAFYGNRPRVIAAPLDLVPKEMQEINVREICGGELYCLTFRKPLHPSTLPAGQP